MFMSWLIIPSDIADVIFHQPEYILYIVNITMYVVDGHRCLIEHWQLDIWTTVRQYTAPNSSIGLPACTFSVLRDDRDCFFTSAAGTWHRQVQEAEMSFYTPSVCLASCRVVIVSDKGIKYVKTIEYKYYSTAL